MNARFAVFVINLDAAAARRAHAERVIAGLPFAAERLSAVDGRRMAVADRERLVLPRRFAPANPFPLEPGEIGCFLSHRTAWQAIVDRDLDFGILLEDDVVPTSGFAQAVAALAADPEAWDYVQLHRGRRRGEPPVAEVGGLALFRATPPRLVAAAVAVSAGAARKLLAASETIDRPVDAFVQLAWVHGVAVDHPATAVVEPVPEIASASTIQKRRHALGPAAVRRQVDRWLYRRRVAARARAFQNRSPAQTRS